MELTLRLTGLVPGFGFRLGGFLMEFDWPFLRLGKWSLWLERTGHRPEGGKWFEVWREDAGTVHVFGLGRRLVVSCGGAE